jgi:hypothetical protein
MTAVYIATINRIASPEDRLTFSMYITEYVPETLSDDNKRDLERGYTITPETLQDNPLFILYFEILKEKGYWSPWMQDWTSATIYRLYQGIEEVSV